ncbi:MAG TPA: glycosyltransferase, partial [Chthoniobacterales bacterium]|nr:glycosyltransferase [Chthoniobacterales bacterium]
MAGPKPDRSTKKEKPASPAALSGCTIVTRKTVPNATVLARSFKRFYPKSHFFALLLDQTPPGSDSRDGIEWLSLSDLPLEEEDRRWLPLLCTADELPRALKPSLLQKILRGRRGVIAYFEPEIKIFAGLNEMVEKAREHPFVLFPMASRDRKDRTPRDPGMMLLGANSQPFLSSWQRTVQAASYENPEALRATEQLVLEAAAALFPTPSTNAPAFGASYQNLPGHTFAWSGHRYEIDGEPLRFFHFKGFDPRRPHLLSEQQGNEPLIRLSREPALAKLCDEYREELLSAGFQDISPADPGSTDSPSNGLRIDRHIRRIYREELAKFRADQGAEPPNLFTTGDAAVIDWLNEPAEGAPHPITRYMVAIRASRPDVQGAFPDPLGEDAAAFLEWFLLYGRYEEHANEALVPAHPPAAALAHDAAKKPPAEQVNVAGYFHAELGLGEAARLLLTALEAEGVAHRAFPYGVTASRQDHPFADGPASGVVGDINLICVNADQLPQFARQNRQLFLPGSYSIGVWFWEVEDFPAELHAAFDYVDEIWVATEFMRQTFLKVSPRPIFKFPLPIVAPEIDSFLSRADLGLPDRFSFLFSFDFLSVLERKNPVGLIEAFKGAFKPGEGPVLLIKTINGEKRIREMEKLLYAAADHPDIMIRDGYLSALEKNTLTARCDAYISLHRSEGFGLTLSEAMSLGRPALATGYSGNLEFMTAENSFLCSYATREIGPGAEPYPATSHWAEPDIHEAADLMRRVYFHPEDAKARAEKALSDINRLHTPAAAGRTIAQRIELLRRQRPSFAELAASRLARKLMTAKQLREEVVLERCRAEERISEHETKLARKEEALRVSEHERRRTISERETKLAQQEEALRVIENERRELELEQRRTIEEHETKLAQKEEALRVSENERRDLEKRLHTILQQSRAEARAAQAEAASLSARLEKIEREAWDNKVRRAAVNARLHEREQALQSIQASPVWKAAKPLWKLHQHLSGQKNTEENAAPEELLFAIDAPSAWTTSREIVVVRGWCFARSGHALAGIRAKVGKKGHLARYGLARTDLIASYPTFPEASHAGFAIQINGVP